MCFFFLCKIFEYLLVVKNGLEKIQLEKLGGQGYLLAFVVEDANILIN